MRCWREWSPLTAQHHVACTTRAAHSELLSSLTLWTRSKARSATGSSLVFADTDAAAKSRTAAARAPAKDLAMVRGWRGFLADGLVQKLGKLLLNHSAEW